MTSVKTDFNKVFKAIEDAKRVEDLQEIRPEFLRKYFLSTSKYPDIPFTLSKKEINDLGGLEFTLSQKILENELSSLERLLLSMLWKNGDFGKEKHILEGILEATDFRKKETGLVFYQFGRRLENPKKEPIIDQHILRAFRFQFNPSKMEVDQIIKKEELTKKDVEDILAYKIWVNEQADKINEENHIILFEIDKILFAIGRFLKRNKSLLFTT